MHEGSDRAEPSLAQLLTGIINDAKALVRHELALAHMKSARICGKPRQQCCPWASGLG